MRLNVEINGLTVIDCDVVDLLIQLAMSGAQLRISPGDKIIMRASNKQHSIQEFYERPQETNSCCECPAVHDQEEIDWGICSACGGLI